MKADILINTNYYCGCCWFCRVVSDTGGVVVPPLVPVVLVSELPMVPPVPVDKLVSDAPELPVLPESAEAPPVLPPEPLQAVTITVAAKSSV